MNRTRDDQAKPITIALAAMSGQTIEYYDFYVYGTAAAVFFGPLFFPQADPLVGTLLAFATVGVGFLARPLGGIIFGHFGDRVGRKNTLVVALLMMGIGTMLIGMLPVYDQIGIWAPIALTVIRFVQGISFGGEWGGAALLSIENSSERKRNFYGSFPQLGSPLGLLLASGAISAVMLLSREVLLAWAWRIPFLLSGVLLIIGMFIRLRIQETPEFEKVVRNSEKAKIPLLEVIRRRPRALIFGLMATFLTTGGYFLINTFTITYVTEELGLSAQVGLIAQIINAIVQGSLILVVGLLSLRRSPRLIGAVSASLVAAWAFPLYALMQTGQPVVIWAALAVATMLQTGLWAVLPALLTAQFPVELAYTGISLSFQGAAMVGGFTPFFATLILKYSEDNLWAVASLLAAVGLISAVGCLGSRGSWTDRGSRTSPQTAESGA